MGEKSYYNKLINAASERNKTEMEVYENVSAEIDEILKNESSVENKIRLLKALIAYAEGKCSNGFYMLAMQLAYAVLIGAAGMAAGMNIMDNGIKAGFVIMLAIFAVILLMCSHLGKDFHRAVVLYVLRDKLEDLLSKKENTKEEKSKPRRKRLVIRRLRNGKR